MHVSPDRLGLVDHAFGIFESVGDGDGEIRVQYGHFRLRCASGDTFGVVTNIGVKSGDVGLHFKVFPSHRVHTQNSPIGRHKSPRNPFSNTTCQADRHDYCPAWSFAAVIHEDLVHVLPSDNEAEKMQEISTR